VVLNQIVVGASRVEESIGQVPVTVEKLDQRQIEQISDAGLGSGPEPVQRHRHQQLKHAHTSFSTRGFNSSRAERVIQLADYMDTQLPSLSTNFGNLLGMPVLDVASIELCTGRLRPSTEPML
jgi:hypothetical protein